jgi:DNA helicase-2/ATP-dependent DNA helicase PcrA
LSPTEEQQAIVEHTRKNAANLMVNALAGTGKSATLKLIDKVHRTKPALYLVFNKRNAEEAIKSGEFSSTTTIKTFNGCGHGIWAKVCTGPLNLQKDKMRQLWKAEVDAMTYADRSEAWLHYSVVMDGLEKAKALGYVPPDCPYPHQSTITPADLQRGMDERPDPFAMDLINSLLSRSIHLAFDGLIDFNDQIYMPALFGGPFPKFPRVMVDEYQDQSPVNHALLARLVTGRIIGVGDPNQNIYGFRGALAGGMSAAVRHYQMDELPLSVSFRCPSEIVKAAQWHVPQFRWIKEGGSVKVNKVYAGSEFPDDSTIICRNNAPLLSLAFKLISNGRSVSVLGSELGPRLVGIMKKLGDPTMTRAATCAAIEAWREQKLAASSKSADDLADCMRVFVEHGTTLSQMISYAEHLFKQQGTIRLLTGHKSKGLEFDNVYFLDPHLLNLSHNQDRNLRYVIQTRSQNLLTELDSSVISW